jgi:hypothetical protein
MKKQLTFLMLLALVGAFMLSLEGCGDKCEGSKQTSAEFKIYNELYYYDKENGKTVEKIKQVEEDTLMVGSYVNFEALDQNATSYEWTIGSDTRKRTGKKVTVFFNNESVADESPITIKLKLTRNPDTECFPNDIGVDSVMRKVYFLKQDKWPLYGKYQGSDEGNLNALFVVEITNEKDQSGLPTNFIKNLPNSCNTNRAYLGSSTAFEFTINQIEVFGQELNCYFRQLDKKIGYLSADRENIIIEYEFTKGGVADSQKQKRIFHGTRIK